MDRKKTEKTIAPGLDGAENTGLEMSLLFRTMHTHILEYIVDKTGNLLQKKVLFIGGGVGREIFYLKRKFGDFNAVNIDINPGQLKACEKNLSEKGFTCHTMEGDASSLPFNNNTFDLVLFYNSIHHMEDTSACLKEALRVGGMVCVADRAKCLISAAGKKLGIIKKEAGGYYARELDIRWLHNFLRTVSVNKKTVIKRHLLFLLFLNRHFHDRVSRHSLFTKIYIFSVIMVNALLGTIGNGIILIIEDKIRK